MKRWAAVLLALAMLLGNPAAIADVPQAALEEARVQVPPGAELQSTGEDDNRVELTYKDAAANEYRVLFNRHPLYLLRVNMKSPREEGAPALRLDEAAVLSILGRRFPGAFVRGLYLEYKGEDEVFVHALLDHQGFFYKVRLNAGNGHITHYVQRGIPPAALFGGGLISRGQAFDAAIAQVPGGQVTDIQFGSAAGQQLYLVEVHLGEERFDIILSAADGGLLSLRALEASLVPFVAPAGER